MLKNTHNLPQLKAVDFNSDWDKAHTKAAGAAAGMAAHTLPADPAILAAYLSWSIKAEPIPRQP